MLLPLMLLLLFDDSSARSLLLHVSHGDRLFCHEAFGRFSSVDNVLSSGHKPLGGDEIQNIDHP